MAPSIDSEVLAPAAKKGGNSGNNGKKGLRVNETSTQTNEVSAEFCERGGHITVQAATRLSGSTAS